MQNHFLVALRTAEENMPLWKELWFYFLETYFYNETAYEYLNMDGSSFATLRNIVIGILIGVCIAGFAAVFNKRIWGDFVRLLLREECLTPERGKTLPELNCAHKLWLRFGVKRGVNLRRVVRCREEEDYLREIAEEEAAHAEKRKENPSLPKRIRSKPFRVDPDAHHFYIPEEMKYMADVKFEKKGNTWLGAVLFVVIMAIVGFVFLMVLPYLLSLLNDLVGSFQSAGSDQILT